MLEKISYGTMNSDLKPEIAQAQADRCRCPVAFAIEIHRTAGRPILLLGSRPDDAGTQILFDRVC
jgi:hypothetical protein